MIPAEQYDDDDLEVLDAVDFEEDDDDGEEFGLGEEGEYEEFDEPEDFLEEWDEPEEESLAERRRRRRYRRRFPVYRQRRYRRRYPRPRRYRRVRGIRRGIVRTPAGAARVQLPKSVPTRASVDNRFKEVKRETARAIKAVARVDRALEKNTSIVDKKVNAVSADLRRSTKRLEKRIQQATLLPLLLQSPPQIETVELPPDAQQPPSPAGQPRTVNVNKTNYKPSTSNILPLLLLSGGLGGGSGSSSSMLVLALALSGGLGGSKQ